MAFDQPTRNRLARFVGDSRALLTEEFIRQLQLDYGLDPTSGEVTDLARLNHLDDARRETARLLRETLAYYMAGQTKQTAQVRRESLERIVREQAFTVLNRLCALRMMEARGLLLESVGQGYRSKGFQLYSRLAGPALGETADTYCSYLFSLFDEFAVDLPVLFDRFSPQGRLFPRPTTLLQLLDEINHPDIDRLWAEDETIGWIYQYFNSVEERRQMRAESQAPRNSRELAVRNQFFTPRYVVEFLTDNTLGRLWYEMTQGNTALKETCRYLVRRPTEIFLVRGETPPDHSETAADLSQEELLKQPVYIPYRPLKDPRDLKMLDPACGSMHFGLYAFDLYEQIYAEAWALEVERGPHALIRPPGLKALRDIYPDEVTFRRDIPRLIIEHNIHGIDIDPRAVQIAGLSLWLRAQKSWQNQKVKPHERPTVTRSNVVTAEPMPGDVTLLDEFIARHLSRTPEEKLLGQLLRRVFEAMKLAGEAGSLLKIEEEIAADIAEAKAKWYSQPEPKQVSFLEDTQPEQADLGLDVSGITDTAFWDKTEKQIYNALQQYATQAENGYNYRRRLFANDAAWGFAFIDLCRQRYDVVLMNPPFGSSSSNGKSLIDSIYPNSRYELACCFLQLAFENLSVRNGLTGAIITRAPFFLYRLSEWRKHLLMAKNTIKLLLDMGVGVLDDALVETTACVVGYEANLSMAIDARGGGNGISPNSLVSLPKYLFDRQDILAIPNTPVAYWAPKSIMSMFARYKSFGSYTEVKQGLQTRDNERFLRLWWETPSDEQGVDRRWISFAKGGEFNRFYLPTDLMVDWSASAMASYLDRKGQMVVLLTGKSEFYAFKAGLTYSSRSQSGFSVRVLPANSLYSANGPCIYSEPVAKRYIDLAYLNSDIVGAILGLLTTFGSYSEGYVEALPYPTFNKETKKELESLAKECVFANRIQFQLDETCREFVHASLSNCNSLLSWTNQLQMRTSTNADKVSGKRQTIEKLLAEELCLSSTDLSFVESHTLAKDAESLSQLKGFETPRETLVSIVMFSLGLIFGRWDVRYATGEKEPPELPDPFAPLPACPLGMLQNSQGLPATPTDVPPDYPLRISWSGILVDDLGHPEDIEARVREALHVIWPDNADAIEQEACQILGVGSLRDYFGNPNNFFDDHLKRYSKSRRAAPIYWPLSTPSGSYTLWLYYHRLDNQILYTCANDFVDPKLKEVGQQVSALRQKARRSESEEADLTRLSDLETELHDFRAELLRLAAFWRPNLNNGVEITAAPLWRLFQHRPWQSRLRETWEKLEAGEYDWAHLAMSIWPERVVPKCVEDRSLAIAHDIEDLFWVEDEGNWRLLREADQEIAGQIERWQNAAHARLGQCLADLAAGAGRGMPAYQVWQHLSEGDWDDTRVALALWPERVAEKCWDQPFLAAQLGLKIPGKQTEANRQRFLKQIVAASVSNLTDAVAVAFQNEDDAFDTAWQALTSGKRDEQPLALVLWPERAVNKCAGNLELATQHNLRRYFWIQPPGGGPWRRRYPQAQEIRDEIARRQSK